MVLAYLLLALYLYLYFSITFYWPIAFTGSLIYLWCSTILYLLHAYPYSTLLSSTGPLPFTMVLSYLLLAHCVSLWYSTTFFWFPAYTYGFLLPSTVPLPIPTCMVLFYFYLPNVYPIVLYYGTLLSSTG